MAKVSSQKEVDTNISENDKTESTFKRCDMRKSAEDTCEICKKRQGIEQRNKEAKRKQEFQAKKMLEKSNKRFKPDVAGENVNVPVPDVDMGQLDYGVKPSRKTSSNQT